MENEYIKVGELVRTRNKGIQKIAYLRPNATVNKYAYFIGYDDDGDRLYGILKTTDILKHSSNLIDIIEDNDFCKIEFYSPRYEKRGTRIFEVSKIDEYITFENMHCDLFMKNGEWSNHDKRLNPVIKEIYTREMMESISYKVTKM